MHDLVPFIANPYVRRRVRLFQGVGQQIARHVCQEALHPVEECLEVIGVQVEDTQYAKT